MQFCPKCGNSIDDSAMFCPSCGASLGNYSKSEIASETKNNNNESVQANTTFASNVVKRIGIALTLVGVICGIIAIIFISSRGTSFSYDTWDYSYAGGRGVSIGIAVLAGVSLLIGLCMIIGSSISHHNKEKHIIFSSVDILI